jgi:hypothetical protein
MLEAQPLKPTLDEVREEEEQLALRQARESGQSQLCVRQIRQTICFTVYNIDTKTLLYFNNSYDGKRVGSVVLSVVEQSLVEAARHLNGEYQITFNLDDRRLRYLENTVLQPLAQALYCAGKVRSIGETLKHLDEPKIFLRPQSNFGTLGRREIQYWKTGSSKYMVKTIG